MNDKVIFLSSLLNSNFVVRNSKFEFYLNQLPYEQQVLTFDKIDKKIDERWYLSHLLSLKTIDKAAVGSLIKFLNDLKFADLIRFYDISQFINYVEKDPKIFDFFEDKFSKNEVSEYFFFPYYISEDIPERIVKSIGFHRVQNLYLRFIKNNVIDELGVFYRFLLKEADSNFIFDYLCEIHKSKSYSSTDNIPLSYTWDSTYADEGIIKYINYLITEDRLFFIGLDSCLEDLLKSDIDRSYKLIETIIQDTSEEDVLIKIYNLSLQIFKDESTLNLFELLKEKDISDLFFQKLHLTMRYRSWSGSRVPLIDSEIIFLDKVAAAFSNLEDIHHLTIINKHRENLKEQKRKELLSDFLNE